MGFSVSGATAVLLLGLFIATGTMATAVANGYGQVADAEQDRADRILSQQETAIEITAVDVDSNTITITNTGAQELRVSETTLLVNGTPQSATNTTAAGDSKTDLWLPGEELTIEPASANLTTTDRIKIVTEFGVAATTEAA